MKNDSQSQLAQLAMDPAAKRRSSGTMTMIFVGVGVVIIVALLVWKPWANEGERYKTGVGKSVERGELKTSSAATAGLATASPAVTSTNVNATPASSGSDAVLVVSGYIVNRERIEISPRFMGVVNWIGVTSAGREAKRCAGDSDDLQRNARKNAAPNAEAGGIAAQVYSRFVQAQ